MEFKNLQAGKYFSFKETEIQGVPNTSPICIKTKDGGYTILSGSMIGAHFESHNLPPYKEIIDLNYVTIEDKRLTR